MKPLPRALVTNTTPTSGYGAKSSVISNRAGNQTSTHPTAHRVQPWLLPKALAFRNPFLPSEDASEGAAGGPALLAESACTGQCPRQHAPSGGATQCLAPPCWCRCLCASVYPHLRQPESCRLLMRGQGCTVCRTCRTATCVLWPCVVTGFRVISASRLPHSASPLAASLP